MVWQKMIIRPLSFHAVIVGRVGIGSDLGFVVEYVGRPEQASIVHSSIRIFHLF